MILVAQIHSFWRWIVLLAAILAVVKAFAGWFGKQSWTSLDDRLGLFFTVAIDIQFLLGLILYIGVLTGNYAKFYAGQIGRLTGEHVVLGIIALAVAHIGRSRAKKQSTAQSKHQTVAIAFVIALLLIAVAIPRGAWTF